MFKNVKSADEFAAVLKVPRKAIAIVLVEPISSICKSTKCRFPAIKRNRNHCPCHKKCWYPLLSERSGLMLGPKFLRPVGRFRDCDCDMKACKAAGYFPAPGAIFVPKACHDVACNTPTLLSVSQKQKLLNTKCARLYLFPGTFL